MRKLNSILNSALVETATATGLSNQPVVEAINRAESPIEAQLMTHVMRYNFVIGDKKGLEYLRALEIAATVPFRPFVFQQVWIGPYRADFCFIMAYPDGRGIGLVVEADGKDWHYSNEDQIVHDNERLAYFAKHRVFTMRFLGREIWRDCESVIGHVRDFFEERD